MSFDDWTHEGRTSPPSPPTPPSNEPPTPELFLLNPEMRRFVLDGDRRALRSNPFVIGCLLVFLLPFYLAGVGVPLGVLAGIWVSHQISADPVRVQARVLGTRVSEGDDSDTYYVRYSFEAEGRTQTGETSCRTRPSLVHAASESPNFGGLPFLGLWTLIWDGTLALMTVAGWKAWGRQRRLQQGQLIGGILTSASGERDSDGDYILTVHYRFQPPQGPPLEGKSSRIRRDLNSPPAAGTPVAVLYADPATHDVM